MQILSLLGSPRADGNTAKVLAWTEAALQSAGHTIDHVHLVDHALAGCRECYACKSGRIPLCAVEDDGNVLYKRLIDTDLVLLASPLFCWNFPAQMKPFIDRMFCFTGWGKESTSKLEGKRFALLMTSAGPVAGNGEILLRTYEKLLEYLHARDAGRLAVPLCTAPAALGEEVRQQAVRFAEEIGAA